MRSTYLDTSDSLATNLDSGGLPVPLAMAGGEQPLLQRVHLLLQQPQVQLLALQLLPPGLQPPLQRVHGRLPFGQCLGLQAEGRDRGRGGREGGRDRGREGGRDRGREGGREGEEGREMRWVEGEDKERVG